VTEKSKGTKREKGGGGKGGIYGRQESGRLGCAAPSPIGGPLKPGGPTPQPRL